ncbi:hypothetical protein MGL_2861 [Malassezia globosa CBS 7966]|uniref:Uncharacterized protein n=1 Tax=Malassezia globosa (strain ATCC MYA-4612 / CBS 7966) TaxID=425265 RepID=A8Q665_MALGO|nr:uncharacterized protein MGL_2861 [Malassezia globosa CBS 7966]EDP42661.1 hypothetical protein MGL_2861 [Malassezia globosa CBS 7966]
MQRLFGLSQNKAPKPDLQQAITSTDARADATQVKISRLDAELGRYRDQMKKMREGPGKSAIQQRAIRVLRQKRMYEAQMEQLVQQSFNMEQSVMVTENLRNTMATVDAMQQANKNLKKTYRNINVDKIEQIQDEMEDLMEQSGALQETLARSYATPDDIDETELEAELEALEEQPLEHDMEVPSYLQHTTGALLAQPDFIDELPPSQEAEVRADALFSSF